VANVTATTSLDARQLQVVRAALERGRQQPGPLLEVLHAVQGQLGFVPTAAVPVIADELNLSRAEVHGVLTFYHYFRDQPPGAHVVQLCRAEACQALGANKLAQHVKRRLGVDFHGTSGDGKFTLEAVYCLGLCARAPAAMIDGELHGCVTEQGFDDLLHSLGDGV
jgi:formate dehydrogenase subunit gamma